MRVVLGSRETHNSAASCGSKFWTSWSLFYAVRSGMHISFSRTSHFLFGENKNLSCPLNNKQLGNCEFEFREGREKGLKLMSRLRKYFKLDVPWIPIWAPCWRMGRAGSDARVSCGDREQLERPSSGSLVQLKFSLRSSKMRKFFKKGFVLLKKVQISAVVFLLLLFLYLCKLINDTLKIRRK